MTTTLGAGIDPAIADATDVAGLRALRSAIGTRLATIHREAGIDTTLPGVGITPGCRVRLTRISPVAAMNLTGTVQEAATGKKTYNRYDILLDESSTIALRADHRVENSRKISKPQDDAVRHLMPSVPIDCMLLADGDS
ncbi:hypothetical protein ACFYWP_39850 [Actinacidiphila glaucinigra]|uniref:hypothetical protein n=1 Tax=Actinacidiphila glaucinigra TaxID=235986 RepID=UPI0036C1E0B6